MNRVLVFGIAMFLAFVGFALVGGDDAAYAGHGCHGCNGCASACDGGCYDSCYSACDCSGRRHGLLHRLKARRACHGCYSAPSCCGVEVAPACCGAVEVPACCGTVIEGEAAPAVEGEEAAAPAPETTSIERRPVGFRMVHFRR